MSSEIPAPAGLTPGPDHAATPITFGTWLAARWKALVALVAPTLIGYLGVVLIDPATGTQIQSVLPDSFKWVVPPLIGILTSLVVHRVPNQGK